jgi:hypothetical protein
MAQIIVIPFKDGKVLLKVPEIKDLQNIDIDKVTRIQYDKLAAEILTFPVILNRIGLILAEAESAERKAELRLKIGKAELSKKAVKSLDIEDLKPTENNVMNWIRRHEEYKSLNEAHIEAIRKKSIVNSAYWAAKDKSDKLNKLSNTLTSDEFAIENMASEINGIKVIVKENPIK